MAEAARRGKRAQERERDSSDAEEEAAVDGGGGGGGSSSDEDDSEGSGTDGDGGKLVLDVDFEFFDPTPDDFHAIKQMVTQTFDKDAVNLSELTNLLLSQKTLGTCVKVEGTADAYSFLSVLNLRHYKNKPCVQQIRTFVLGACKDPAKRAQLEGYLDDPAKTVGMVFNERLINMPVQTAPPMYKMLLEEIGWACQDGARTDTPAQGEPYAFDFLLFILKTYRHAGAEPDDDTGPRSKRARTAAAAGPQADTTYYFHEEEEYIHQSAVFQVEYRPSEAQAATRHTFAKISIKPARLLVLVPFARMAGIVERMERDVAAGATSGQGSARAGSAG